MTTSHSFYYNQSDERLLEQYNLEFPLWSMPGNETVLQLSNGSVLMNIGLDVISVGGGSLRKNQWYQLYATK